MAMFAPLVIAICFRGHVPLRSVSCGTESCEVLQFLIGMESRTDGNRIIRCPRNSRDQTHGKPLGLLQTYLVENPYILTGSYPCDDLPALSHDKHLMFLEGPHELRMPPDIVQIRIAPQGIIIVES